MLRKIGSVWSIILLSRMLNFIACIHAKHKHAINPYVAFFFLSRKHFIHVYAMECVCACLSVLMLSCACQLLFTLQTNLIILWYYMGFAGLCCTWGPMEQIQDLFYHTKNFGNLGICPNIYHKGLVEQSEILLSRSVKRLELLKPSSA